MTGEPVATTTGGFGAPRVVFPAGTTVWLDRVTLADGETTVFTDGDAMERMLMLLRRSPEQEAALQQLIEDQQNPASAHYRQWLTPQQFGPALEDLEKITAWLESQGFRVAGVANGRGTIEFSGTAAQVERALRTGIHSYLVDGERHWANAQDPQIPAALSPAVAGIVSLHDFPMKALHRSRGAFRKAPAAAAWTPAGLNPQYTLPTSGSLVQGIVGPYDFATI